MTDRILWHRHTRGRVIDLNGEVCPNSYLDNTTVSTDGEVYNSWLQDSWVQYGTVFRSTVGATKLDGSSVLSSKIWNCEIENSKVYESLIESSEIRTANVRGAVIKNSKVSLAWVGKAVLDGVYIDQAMRIGVGVWTAPPRYFEIDDGIAVGVGITESTDGHAYVGCRRRPIKTWINGAKRFQKVMGWKGETVDMIVQNLKQWL